MDKFVEKIQSFSGEINKSTETRTIITLILGSSAALGLGLFCGYRWGFIKGQNKIQLEIAAADFDSSGGGAQSRNQLAGSERMSSVARSECSFYEGTAEEGPNLKVIFVIRTDLQMSKGKVASQVGHAAIAMYKRMYRRNKEMVKAWEEFGASKIALRCDSETELFTIKEEGQKRGVPVQVVVDSGKTGTDSIKPGTRTVMVMGPATQAILGEFTGHLKLY